MNASGQRICLNMIVKNEAPVIRRCLTSVLPIIDHWVIVDTGSEDGTQQIIREFLADLPGELHERPWVNFAHNRSEALELAREQGDYIFVIDADEILEIEPGTELPQLILDSYNVQVRYGNTKYLRRQLVRNALPWRYEGVLHEYITCEQARTEQFLPGLCTVPHHDGARALDPLTYKKDAALLEKAVQEDPTNARYVFYLAQSHRDAGDFEAALLVYKQRVDLGGWREEVWYSLYQIAQLKERLRHPWPEAMDAYLTAWQYQPHRAGPLYRIAMHYQAKSEYHTSHLFLSKAMQLPTPGPEGLFVEHTLYAYQLALDHAVASYYVGDQEAAVAGNSNLLRSGQLPAFAVDQVIRNRRFSLDLHYKQNRREQPHTSSLYVFVPITDNPSLELDDCLDSLLSQQSDPFQVVILSPRVDSALKERVTLSENFSLVQQSSPDVWQSIRHYLSTTDSPCEIAMLLQPTSRLDTSGTITSMRTLFSDANCAFAYGQFRTASGSLGTAEPPTSSDALTKLTTNIICSGPVLIRSSILKSLAESSEINTTSLLRTAGYSQIRFSDEIWSIALEPLHPSTTKPVEKINTSHLHGIKLPKISCMMVTLDRLALVKHSILLFAQQTYPERELIIVTDGKPLFREAIERFVQSCGLDNVRFVYPEGPRRTLGQLRNIAMQAATGEILCQWDDDDSNHPERLMVQAQYMLQNNAGACFLSDHLQLIEEKQALCWIDWTAGATSIGPENLAPGTLMMLRNDHVSYPEEGPLSRQGEDSALLYALHRSVDVKPLSGNGHLYLYRFHGRNTFSREHHYRLSSFRYTSDMLQKNMDKLRDAARYYALPQPCYVLPREGPAFTLER